MIAATEGRLGIGELTRPSVQGDASASRTEVLLDAAGDRTDRVRPDRSPGRSWKFMMALRSFIQHDFAQGNGVAIDLEAVVEWRAFLGGPLDCGCPCEHFDRNNLNCSFSRWPRVNWRPRHRLRRTLHGRAGNRPRPRGHRNKYRPEAEFRVFAHDSARYAEAPRTQLEFMRPVEGRNPCLVDHAALFWRQTLTAPDVTPAVLGDHLLQEVG